MQRGAPKVVFQQSEANNPDVGVLEKLLSEVPRLRQLRQLQRLAGGYSSCRVYLVQATFEKDALNYWIIKVGPREDIKAEDERTAIARAHIPVDNSVPRINSYTDELNGVLIFDYAGYTGVAPKDLEAVLKRVEGTKALDAVLDLVETWTSSPAWHVTNITQTLKDLTEFSLPRLPEAIRATQDFKTITSPDFGQAFSNPVYYFQHDIKRIEVQAPYSFTHGDLNLRNILFPVGDNKAINAERPIVIDFSHAADDGIALLDYAKLEACIRYQTLPSLEQLSGLQQVIVLLEASRQALELGSAPESIEDRQLQETWRFIAQIRSRVAKVISKRKDAEKAYWALLLVHAIETTAYETLSSTIQNLAYLDAAALFTNYVLPRELSAPQKVLLVHPYLSPPVEVPGPSTTSAVPVLVRTLSKGQGVVVVGSSWGKQVGIEQLPAFVSRLYRDLLNENAPPLNFQSQLEILAMKKSRQDILRAIKNRAGRWPQFSDASLNAVPWAATVSFHFHDQVHARLLSSGSPIVRIDNEEDLLKHGDAIVDGTHAYMAIYGDTATKSDALALTTLERTRRYALLARLAGVLERRQRPIALMYWKCEDLDFQDITQLKAAFSSLSVPVDYFFLSDQDDATRDYGLKAIGVVRLDTTLSSISKQLLTTPVPSALAAAATIWQRGDTVFPIPDTARLTKGQLAPFAKVGSIGPASADRVGADFLLGAAPSRSDILDGRVVRRVVLDRELLPAIRSAVEKTSEPVQLIVVEGRPGAGVSTLLCFAAHEVTDSELCPTFVLTDAIHRSFNEIREAASLLAETSRTTKLPALVFLELADTGFKQIDYLAETITKEQGEAVIIIGGRRDVIKNKLEGVPFKYSKSVSVDDSLTSGEWEALARILREHGFSSAYSHEELTKRLKAVGRLLPAIYEATDRKNRKFREIVAYEYHRLREAPLVQKAYRLICYLGAFGLKISQFWLLKALGDRSISDAAKILNSLSDEIVIELPDRDSADQNVLIAPLHRLIAEEVLDIAVPEATDRLEEICSLISTANLGSQREGFTVAELLTWKGSLVSWIKTLYPDSPSLTLGIIRRLFECAFENAPIHPDVEVMLRQHYALALRWFYDYEEALQQIRQADSIDPGNSATMHIMGLIHESRATRAWREHLRSPEKEKIQAEAFGNEEDALEFFRRVRELQPAEEYGYESEARYYRKKAELFRQVDEKSTDSPSASLASESKIQLYSALSLLKAAHERVPQEKLIETPKTRAFILSQIGEIGEARKLIDEQIAAAADPLRKKRLQKTAATLAAEAEDWKLVVKHCSELMARGEHEAFLYLLLDDAHDALRASVEERIRWLRESAEEWNRQDLETQLRWAMLCMYRGDWLRANDVMKRADDLANRHGLSFFAREDFRGIVRKSIYHADVREFTGVVERLWKANEGEIASPELKLRFFFRVSRGEASEMALGTTVSFNLRWRIRGFRAVNVKKISSPETPT